MTTLKEHQGHTITFNHRHRFDVTGPNIEKEEFHSYDDATTAIADAVKKAEKQTRTILALPALDSDGNPVTLRGVHAANGVFLGCESDAYPAVEWVGALLRESKACRERINVINLRLNGLHIEHRRNYGRVRDYDAAIASLKNDHATATAKAEALALSPPQPVRA